MGGDGAQQVGEQAYIGVCGGGGCETDGDLDDTPVVDVD